jgi:DnaK suppressor protein
MSDIKTLSQQNLGSSTEDSRSNISLKNEIKPSEIILPDGYIPSDSEEYLNPMHLEYFRRNLTEWKNMLLKESEATLENLKETTWAGAGSDFTDRASIETDTAFELRTRDRYRKLIEKIQEALKRIEVGEYGFCEDTGEPIGLKRLRARPIATLCIEAQERHENHEQTHLDEDEEVEA